MSDTEKQAPEVRSEEPELSDETLEQVAGGCQWTDSGNTGGDTLGTFTLPSTFQVLEPTNQ
jgi:hypothetical protein